jgi:FAD/FMN-containing dehydrogenase
LFAVANSAAGASLDESFTMAASAILDQLRAVVGDKHVLTGQSDMAPFLVERRNVFHGQAGAIVRPASVSEVAAVVAACHASNTPIVPQGGNTGLVGGQIPDSPAAIVLSLTRLTAVREVDLASATITVEAGMTLAAVQSLAEAHDHTFPLSLASEGSCTIGGNLATNAGGIAVLAFGNARDLVLGVEVVLADGRVLSNLSKLKKDNSGYDLKDLFIGSEGTLGIITAAVLKLYPRPRASLTVFIGLYDPRAAIAFFNCTQQAMGAMVRSFELLPRIGVDFVLAHTPASRDPLPKPYPWYVLLELATQSEQALLPCAEHLLEQAATDGLIADAAIATSLAQARRMWQLREDLSEVQRLEGGSIKHDVSVPIARIPDFIESASAAVTATIPGGRIVAFGHVGDGNVHFNVSQPIGANTQEFLAQTPQINAIVHALVLENDGSISAEHGIGQLKRDLLARIKDPVALEVMRTLKRALDPKSILNPGKVVRS